MAKHTLIVMSIAKFTSHQIDISSSCPNLKKSRLILCIRYCNDNPPLFTNRDPMLTSIQNIQILNLIFLMSDIVETIPTPSQHKGSHQISINSGDPNLEANLLMSDIVETIPTPSQHKGSHQISIDKYSLALNTSLPCFGNPPLPATEHLGYWDTGIHQNKVL